MLSVRLIVVFVHTLLSLQSVAILTHNYAGFRQEPILAMDVKEAARFITRKIVEKFRRKEDSDSSDGSSQVLSPVC